MRQQFSVLTAGITDDTTKRILKEFKKHGFDVVHQSVASNDQFSSIIYSREWDLILSEHNSPAIDNYSALSLIEEAELEIIFILLGLNTPEESVVEAMNKGVHDHVEKDHLHRLIPAIKREIKHLAIRRRHKRSIKQNKLLSHILTKSLNEIYLVDPQNMEFSYANSATLDNLGYSKDEFYWLTPFDIVSEDDVDLLKQKYDQLLSGKTNRVVLEKYRKRKDGSTYPVEIHLELIEQGGSEFVLGICFDITQRLEDAKELELRKKESKKLALNNKYKSEFIATISHEMRTTLNSVIILSEILSRNENRNLTKDQLEYLDIIQSSNNSLLELLNEVLDLSKIDSGKVDIRLGEVDLASLCQRITRLYTPIAREKGLSFRFEKKPDLPEMIVSDRIRLEQVLKNLISNALKFTSQGEISLVVESVSRKKLSFSVTDTGIGIPDSALSKVFDSYQQAEDSITTLQYGGTGLGLAISKQLIELLGGTIEVSSSVGKGTSFTVTIPTDSTESVSKHAKTGKVKKVESSDITPDKATKKKRSKQGSVLLIDDSNIHNLALKEFLSVKIENCTTAETASEAFSELDKNADYDCIILDMYLPDADGKDVIRKLKNNDRYKDIPVIIYSGKSLTSEEESDLMNFASGIVQKNVKSYRVLLDKIIELIDSK